MSSKASCRLKSPRPGECVRVGERDQTPFHSPHSPHPSTSFLFFHPTPHSGITLKITLLAAGFIIGPSGASVREICRFTGADVRSWTEPPAGPTARRVRAFTVDGAPGQVASAATIILAAIDRYVSLTDGSHAGRTVGRAQEVGGIMFSYQPPPRAVVPQAAALKGGNSNSGGGGSGSGGGSWFGREASSAEPAPPSSSSPGATAANMSLLADLVAALQGNHGGGGGGGGVWEGEGMPAWTAQPDTAHAAWPPASRARSSPVGVPSAFLRAGSSPAAFPPPQSHNAWGPEQQHHAGPPPPRPAAPAPRWAAAMDAAAAAVAAHRSSEEEAWATHHSPAWKDVLAEAPALHPVSRTPPDGGRRALAEQAGPLIGAGWSRGTALSFDGPGGVPTPESDAQAAALAAAMHNLDCLDLAAAGAGSAEKPCVWGAGAGGAAAAHPPPPPATRLPVPPGLEHAGAHPHRLGPITPASALASRAVSAPLGEVGAAPPQDHHTASFWPGI